MTNTQAPNDPIGPLRAALSGRFEIKREIGQGAFATVYLAKDARRDCEVALKVLNADPSSETGELRFIREIRMLARLQHPHIVPLHDSGHAEALLYYLMPYVSGETLRARMSRERQVPIDAAIRIACEAADALSYAHSHGVIHRDIKPENILLSGGHAVVADFGIARAIDIAGVQQLTHSGHGNPGTPAYMSPEQLTPGRQVDGRSDIYSLGCVLYEMLTGKPPVAGKEGLVKRFTELPPKPSSVRKDVPAWLDAVVLQTLACKPEDRFGRAEDLILALSGPSAIDPHPPITTLPRVLTESESKIIAGSNDFAFDLFRTVNLAQRKTNVFISPLSASMALGMTANGANGATYDEMRSTLRLSGATREDVNSGYESLIAMLRGLDPATKFSIANSIWYDQKRPFNASFIEEGKQYFDAKVQALDFKSRSAVTTINSWVSAHTNNRIREVLDGIDSSEVMLLVNAIYFKGIWQKQFDKSETSDAPFYGADGTITTVPMMARAAGVQYAATFKYEVVDLPYGNSAFAMAVVLPNKGADIDAFAQSFNQSKWNSVVSSLRVGDRKVFLPRFRIEWTRLLNDDLQRLGMRLAFSNGDFTRMSPLRPLFITRVLQKTFVDVDEMGTEAAAATAVTTSRGIESHPAAFRADRPFLVVIRDRFSGAILFIGKIAKLPA